MTRLRLLAYFFWVLSILALTCGVYFTYCAFGNPWLWFAVAGCVLSAVAAFWAGNISDFLDWIDRDGD